MSFEDKLATASEHLVFDTRFIDPDVPTGLWLCDNAYEVSAIQINAVCLPSGGDWDNLTRCTAFLQSFCYLLIVCADPKRRKEMVAQIQERVTDMPILVAEDKAFRGCPSVTELREKNGLKAVNEILFHTRELPAYGLLNIADVRMPDVSNMPKVTTGIQEIDQRTGGLLMGLASIWTGKRGNGKSTFVGQLLDEAIDQGEVVCAYSGELPAWQFRYWSYLQIAGPTHVTYTKDKGTGMLMPMVPVAVEQMIDKWLDKRFFLYDLDRAAAHDGESILKTFEYAHRRYGATVFLVDNIMTARFKGSREADFYRAQGEFVRQLVQFAKRNKVHVHIVAHPRKSNGNKQYLDAEDVSGSADITNLVDNVFSIDREFELALDGKTVVKDRTVVSILKNRMFGKFGNIELKFDEKSKRFYRPRSSPEKRKFGWDCAVQQLAIEDTTPPDFDPFPKGA